MEHKEEPEETVFFNFFFITDYLPHALLLEHSDSFSKYDKKLIFNKVTCAALINKETNRKLQAENNEINQN